MKHRVYGDGISARRQSPI